MKRKIVVLVLCSAALLVVLALLAFANFEAYSGGTSQTTAVNSLTGAGFASIESVEAASPTTNFVPQYFHHDCDGNSDADNTTGGY